MRALPTASRQAAAPGRGSCSAPRPTTARTGPPRACRARKEGRSCSLFQPRRARRRLAVQATLQEDAEEEEVQLEGIDRSYCDDFVCTSSPQVEQNIKALARDLTRLSTWTTSLFRKDVSYRDAFLAFKGVPKYQRLTFPRDCVGSPKVLVTRLRMLDKGTAEVEWRLRGSVAVFPIDVDMRTRIELDLITGRVFSYSERWDLGRCSPPARAAFTAARAAWSLRVRAANAGDDARAALRGLSDRGEEEGPRGITVDPMDPTKFFTEEDPTKDLFAVGAIVAFLWLIFQAYSEIEKLKL